MTESQELDRGEAGFGWIINHLPTIIWQRKYYAIAVFAVCTIAAAIAAFALPTLYRSSATLLIESQELPSNIAETPGEAEIAQRIAKIRERVLSRGNLIALINQYDLYPDERRTKPLSEIIEKMRKATNVGARSNDIGGQSAGGSNQENIIALQMTFDYPKPDVAQEVLQSYTTNFLKMDSDVVEDQASLTVRFLEDQAQKLQSQIQTLETQITALKEKNGTVLAGNGSPQLMDTGSYSAQIVALQNQNRQLALEARKGPAGDQEIAQAEAALAAAQALYTDSHPDVVAAREKLKALRAAKPGTADSGGNSAIQEQMKANNEAIAQLTAQREAAVAKVNAAAAGQARAPAILEQASQLEGQANTYREQYKNVADQLMKAQAGARMAGEQRAARLSLVEPANLPDTPSWPNRPLVIGGGAAAGAALGLLLAMIVELLRRPLRSPVQIESLGAPVLGVVPIFEPPSKPKRRWRLFFWRREPSYA